jgi:hypothetical protein
MAAPVAHAALSPHASTAPIGPALDDVTPQAVQRACQGRLHDSPDYEAKSSASPKQVSAGKTLCEQLQAFIPSLTSWLQTWRSG